MIHQSMIDSARTIKLEYNKTQKELEKYFSELEILSKEFKKSSEEVKDIEKKISQKKMTVDGVRQGLMNVLKDLESKYTHLLKDIKDINGKLEFLKEQEITLYNSIKKKYPSLSDEQIVKEIQSKLEPLK